MRIKKLLVISTFVMISGLAFAEHERYSGHDHGPKCENKHQSNRPQDPKERFEEHQAQLHERLKLSLEQDKAWKTFQDQMTPKKETSKPDFESLSKLSTLQRLDKLEALDKEHQNEKTQRSAAIRTFYAKLNDTQKKVFDEDGFPPPPPPHHMPPPPPNDMPPPPHQ